MPEPGFKTVTVSEKTYNKLEDYAKRTHRSIPKAVEHLVANSKGVS